MARAHGDPSSERSTVGAGTRCRRLVRRAGDPGATGRLAGVAATHATGAGRLDGLVVWRRPGSRVGMGVVPHVGMGGAARVGSLDMAGPAILANRPRVASGGRRGAVAAYPHGGVVAPDGAAGERIGRARPHGVVSSGGRGSGSSCEACGRGFGSGPVAGHFLPATTAALQRASSGCDPGGRAVPHPVDVGGMGATGRLETGGMGGAAVANGRRPRPVLSALPGSVHGKGERLHGLRGPEAGGFRDDGSPGNGVTSKLLTIGGDSGRLHFPHERRSALVPRPPFRTHRGLRGGGARVRAEGQPEGTTLKQPTTDFVEPMEALRLARPGRMEREKLVRWAEVLGRHGERARAAAVYVAVRLGGWRLCKVVGPTTGWRRKVWSGLWRVGPWTRPASGSSAGSRTKCQ